MIEFLKRKIPPAFGRTLLLLLWTLLLANIFLRMDFTEILLNGSRGFPQPAVFQSRLLDVPINWLMPLVQLAWNLAAALPFGMEFLPQALFCWLTALLLFGAGTALSAPIARLAAPLLFLLFLSSTVNGIDPNAATFKEDMLYALTCSMVAYALVLRAREARRRFWSELLLAASTGISFMVKSPLVFLPPLLAAYDIATGKLKRGETSWPLLVALCAVPYAMLLPWTYMNWRIYDIFILFEHNRGADNIIAGALGVIYAIEGGVLPTAGIPDGTNIPLWAIQTVLMHPLTYAGAVLQRIYIEFCWYPWLPTAFCAAFLRFRNNEQFRLLGLFILYFVGMHSLLSIDARYFYPIYPAAILGAAALFDSQSKPSPLPWAKIIFAALFLPLAAAYLLCSWSLLQYSQKAAPAVAAVAKAESTGKMPDATALTLAAKRELVDGTVDTAYTHARAALLKHNSYETVKTYAQTLVSTGRSTLAVFHQRILDCREYRVDCLLLRSLEAFKRGDYAQARKNFYLGYETHKAQAFWFCGSDAHNKPELYKKHRATAEQLALEQWFSQLLATFPEQQAAGYRQLLAQPDPLLLHNKQDLLELQIGEYIVSGKELLNTPCGKQPGAEELRQLADNSVTALLASDESTQDQKPAYTAIPERSRQEQALEHIRACRARTADGQTSALAVILLERLAGENNETARSAAEVASLCVAPKDIIAAINSQQNDEAAIALGKTYLRFQKEPEVFSCVKAREEGVISLEKLPTLSEGPLRLQQLTVLHENKRYAELVASARSYLEDYPQDRTATLYLVDALLSTGNYPEAEMRLKAVGQLPLEAHEKEWVKALKRHLEKAQMSQYFRNLSKM